MGSRVDADLITRMRKYRNWVGRVKKGGKMHCTTDMSWEYQRTSRGRYVVGT